METQPYSPRIYQGQEYILGLAPVYDGDVSAEFWYDDSGVWGNLPMYKDSGKWTVDLSSDFTSGFDIAVPYRMKTLDYQVVVETGSGSRVVEGLFPIFWRAPVPRIPSPLQERLAAIEATMADLDHDAAISNSSNGVAETREKRSELELIRTKLLREVSDEKRLARLSERGYGLPE